MSGKTEKDFPNGITINRAKNGFIVGPKIVRQERDPKPQDYLVFPDIDSLLKFVTDHFDDNS